jgi:hypothetical protein
LVCGCSGSRPLAALLLVKCDSQPGLAGSEGRLVVFQGPDLINQPGTVPLKRIPCRLTPPAASTTALHCCRYRFGPRIPVHRSSVSLGCDINCSGTGCPGVHRSGISCHFETRPDTAQQTVEHRLQTLKIVFIASGHCWFPLRSLVPVHEPTIQPTSDNKPSAKDLSEKTERQCDSGGTRLDR